jgi:RHS repeat-associated protein
VSTKPGEVHNLRFPGQYFDSETGLHQNYFRDYDPKTGRYIEPDPIGIKKGKNHLYIYARNNPLIVTDPRGLYGSGSCTYYQQACAANGGKYECGLAQTFCPAFPTGKQILGNWADCVRQCLQERHKARMPFKDACSDKNNIEDFSNAYDHAACFAGCTANTENPYNPLGIDLPDNDVNLY